MSTTHDRQMISDFVALTVATENGTIPQPDVLTEMFDGLDPELAGLIVVVARELMRTTCGLIELEERMLGRAMS